MKLVIVHGRVRDDVEMQWLRNLQWGKTATTSITKTHWSFIWLQANENYHKVLSENVDNENKTPLKKLPSRNLKYHEEKAVYITEMGVYSLVHKSYIPAAKVPWKLFTNIAMPTINKQEAATSKSLKLKPIKIVKEA